MLIVVVLFPCIMLILVIHFSAYLKQVQSPSVPSAPAAVAPRTTPALQLVQEHHLLQYFQELHLLLDLNLPGKLHKLKDLQVLEQKERGRELHLRSLPTPILHAVATTKFLCHFCSFGDHVMKYMLAMINVANS
jgi:hypothetical protein